MLGRFPVRSGLLAAAGSLALLAPALPRGDGPAAAAAALAPVDSGLGQQASGMQATAELRDPSGRVVGQASFTEDGSGVQISVQVRELPAGEHGIHIHAVGRCDPPDFMSAGGHFNPSQRLHGLQNPQGSHEGDLPNLAVLPDGTAAYTASNTMLTLGLGNPAASVFDADGSALVIHADPDDQTTDPTGNSGGRIACGVIVPTSGATGR